MRNPEQTIGNLIDKQGVAFIGSVDDEGFPNMKAISHIYYVNAFAKTCCRRANARV